nr:unnamed protein product [Digitaria exilis]
MDRLSPWFVLLLSVLVKAFVISGDTNGQDYVGLTAIAASWDTMPSNWVGSDPCKDNWTGITCNGDRVTSITLNSNKFSGPIPASLGSLSKLYWLDLADNVLTGGLPISDGTNPGLDNLTKTLHLLLDNNNFSGSFPPTLGLVTALEVLRLDSNYHLTGPVPANFNNLTHLVELYLENLNISGQLPQALFHLPVLQTVRLRGNYFNGTLNISSDFSSQLELIDLQDNRIEDTSSSVPQLHGARVFTFVELKKITSNFSEANDIGNGSYGKVYRGTLPGGQLVAVKRSQQGSMQGSLEFRTEIELLSRVHHKNVVTLVGFCVDQGEQMLIYEYVPNGTLRDSLTGKSGVRLDWRRRLRVVLGTAKGVAYLHEYADPPIVHRDIKSSNVLLDDRLNAKVSDFGLSKPLGVDGRGHVTTQVKGTMGYLDPEYYVTQHLTEKSDVYSFGVLMLEVITARKPLEHGRYVVREVKKAAADRAGKDLCGLQELLDPVLAASPSAPAGLEQYVDLALRCVEEAGNDRPSMGDVVGEIERVMKMAGVGTGADSASGSLVSYGSRSPRHPYSGDSPFEHSAGALPSVRVEPH